MERSNALVKQLANISDPRPGTPVYPLVNVLFMTICAVIAGADDYVAIARFAKSKKKWFSKFLDMSTGIPSHDRFNAILNAIKPEEFEPMLLAWLTELQEVTKGQVIAIDGKTLRRSYDKATGKAAIHMVSAWATENHISLGQQVVDAKSNEITAIPKLLEIIEVSGGLVTIDAMGCQTEIAKKIVAQGGDYCLAVKGNQPKLHGAIADFFTDHLTDDFSRVDAACYHTEEKKTFREDDCRIRKGHGDANFSTLRRTALSLLKQEKTAKCGVKNKRLNAAWSEEYMETVLFST